TGPDDPREPAPSGALANHDCVGGDGGDHRAADSRLLSPAANGRRNRQSQRRTRARFAGPAKPGSAAVGGRKVSQKPKRRERAAFQGERGAFSEEAVRKLLGAGATVLPCQRFEDVFRSLKE